MKPILFILASFLLIEVCLADYYGYGFPNRPSYNNNGYDSGIYSGVRPWAPNSGAYNGFGYPGYYGGNGGYNGYGYYGGGYGYGRDRYGKPYGSPYGYKYRRPWSLFGSLK